MATTYTYTNVSYTVNDTYTRNVSYSGDVSRSEVYSWLKMAYPNEHIEIVYFGISQVEARYPDTIPDVPTT